MSILVESGGGVPIVNTNPINVTPSVANQEIVPSGSYTALKEVTAYGDANFLPENIADGVEIFGVQGSMYQSISSTASTSGSSLGIEFPFSFSGTLDINKIRGVFVYTLSTSLLVRWQIGALYSQLKYMTPPMVVDYRGQTTTCSWTRVTFDYSEYMQSLVGTSGGKMYYFSISQIDENNFKFIIQLPSVDWTQLSLSGSYACTLIYEK